MRSVSQSRMPPTNTPGGPIAARRAPTMSDGGLITRSSRLRWPSACAAARSRRALVFPTTRRCRPSTHERDRDACFQTLQDDSLARIHPAGGVDDVLLRLLFRLAVPAGGKHAGVLAEGRSH